MLLSEPLFCFSQAGITVPARPQEMVVRRSDWFAFRISGSWFWKLRASGLTEEFSGRPTPPWPLMPWQVRQLLAKSRAPRSTDCALVHVTWLGAREGSSMMLYAVHPPVKTKKRTTMRKICF